MNQLDATMIYWSIRSAQHVSGNILPIIRSVRLRFTAYGILLLWWVGTRWAVALHCVYCKTGKTLYTFFWATLYVHLFRSFVNAPKYGRNIHERDIWKVAFTSFFGYDYITWIILQVSMKSCNVTGVKKCWLGSPVRHSARETSPAHAF